MRIAVIGGGISGLAAAHRLLELAPHSEVRLFEDSGRLGGVISTARRDGFVLEHGPDSIITDKPWALDLIRRLGLEGELTGTGGANRRSFVVRDGKLMPVPEGFQLLAPSKFGPLASTPIFSWPGKARMALDLLLPRRTDESDESLGGFVVRRLGREALERMAQPMVAGIYGADAMQLSLRATLPRFADMERDHGSVIRAMWARAKATNGKASSNGVSGARYGLFVTFKNGMQTLPDALAAKLPPEWVSLNTRVKRLKRAGQSWSLKLDSGEAWEAEAAILALPAYGSGALLSGTDPEVGRLLSDIPYASSATMSLCYRREDVPHPLDGFGFVVPSVEGLTLLGCTFTNVKWPHRAPEGVALLRAFLGESALSVDDAELERRVRADLQKLLGITVAPQWTETFRHPRSMAQYGVGHLERLAEIERRVSDLPGLALAGNGYRGIGIPDCIHSGELAAEAVLGV